jgi:hypothetical protein
MSPARDGDVHFPHLMLWSRVFVNDKLLDILGTTVSERRVGMKVPMRIKAGDLRDFSLFDDTSEQTTFEQSLKNLCARCDFKRTSSRDKTVGNIRCSEPIVVHPVSASHNNPFLYRDRL